MRLLAGLLLFLSALPLWAQTDERVALFADSIRYDDPSKSIIAEGNVEAYYLDNRLSTESLRYNTETGQIQAAGQIRLDTAGTTVLLADLATLSDDFRDGLIQGARLILDQQFQVAAVEGARSDGQFNTLYKTVATSCSVCAQSPTPIWRIRATNVTHDEGERRLYFQNAWIDIFGVPVLFVPRLRVPEPGVERASGFLVPSFSSSNVYGVGTKIPYFQPIGDHADLTLTPFLTTGGAAILESEYRQRFAAGALEVNGALALTDGLEQQDLRGYIELNANHELPDDFVLNIAIYRASDRSFLGQFDYSDDDRLTSSISASRVRANSFVDVRAEAYQTLREDEIQGEVPFVLPQATYRKVWHRAGTFAFEAQVLNLGRVDGRDVIKGEVTGDWNGTFTLRNGAQLTGLGTIDGQIYSVSDDPDFDEDVLLRTTPTIGIDLRWPWARYGRRAAHVIEPIAQVLYSDTLGDRNVPNEDSLLPEFDETNLFGISRFPGTDRREIGLRANTGISYTRYDPSGWNLGVTAGRVFKTRVDRQFAEGTGLRTRASDYVTAVSAELPGRFRGIGRSLFDTDLNFKRAELELDFNSDEFDVGTSYTFLQEDDSDPILGLVPERQEIAFDTRYRVTPNWEMIGEWRYDIAAERSIFAEAGVTYGNECLVMTMAVARRFTNVNNVSPSTQFSFEVQLAGLGVGRSEGWPRHACRGIPKG
ncbi:MAG: LPS assembly protein LptD [Pseudomonadota bacterium]